MLNEMKQGGEGDRGKKGESEMRGVDIKGNGRRVRSKGRGDGLCLTKVQIR